MAKFEIKSRWSGNAIFSLETDTLRLCIEAGVKQGANLEGADLEGANLEPIRDDLWAVLSAAPAEVEGLRLALLEGRVNGATYEGDCACLVGTIANVAKCNFEALPLLKPRANRPAERFFLAIKTGDTPENNAASKVAYDWINEWFVRMQATFGKAA